MNALNKLHLKTKAEHVRNRHQESTKRLFWSVWADLLRIRQGDLSVEQPPSLIAHLSYKRKIWEGFVTQIRHERFKSIREDAIQKMRTRNIKRRAF